MTVDFRNYTGEVRTYDDYEAQILDRNMSGDRPILVKFRDKNYEWKSVQVTPDGRYRHDQPFIKPVPEVEQELASFNGVGWTNLRRYKGKRLSGGTIYSTQEEARQKAKSNTIKTVQVKIK